MFDFLLNTSMIATVACVIIFFWKKDPRFGYAAAILLAIVPVMQLLLFLFAPKIDASTEPMRALAVPLQILFGGFCAVCAGVMYRVAKKVEDTQ
jgi:hypothetical protein